MKILNIFLFALIVTATSLSNSNFAYSSTIDDNLVAHWTFDETGGNDYQDSSPNGIAANQQGGVESVPGRFGNALSFDSEGDVVFIHERLNLETSHSLSLWIKYKDDADGVVIGKDAFGYFLYIDQSDFYYNCGGNNATDFVSVPHGGLPSEDWAHIVVVRENENVSFFIDGSQVGDTQTLATNMELDPITTIGRYGTGWMGGELFPTTMFLDDVRIYSVALSANDVAELYDPSPAPENTPPRISLNGSENLDVFVGDDFIDPGVSVEDDEDTEDNLVISTSTDPEGGVHTDVEGTIALTYTVTDTGNLSASATRLIHIIASTTPDVVSTSTDDNSTSTPDTETPPEPDPEPEESGNNNNNENNNEDNNTSTKNRVGSRSRFSMSGGSVLGAFSFSGGQVLGAFNAINALPCSAYLDGSFIGIGYENKPAEVEKLKAFLNEYIGSSLPLNGTLDAATVNAIKKFQELFKAEITTPWYKLGLIKTDTSTGFVQKTTIRAINNLVCPSLQLPMPTLN